MIFVVSMLTFEVSFTSEMVEGWCSDFLPLFLHYPSPNALLQQRGTEIEGTVRKRRIESGESPFLPIHKDPQDHSSSSEHQAVQSVGSDLRVAGLAQMNPEDGDERTLSLKWWCLSWIWCSLNQIWVHDPSMRGTNLHCKFLYLMILIWYAKSCS